MSEALALVTGSRKWAEDLIIDNTLWEAYCGLVVQGPYTTFKVMHGRNLKGADALADRWAINRYYEGVRVKRVEAHWGDPCRPECQPGHRRTYIKSGWGLDADLDSYCPAQGNYRNQEMVDLHPIVTLAFLWEEKSNGTWDCISRSVKANIPTLITRRGQWPVWAVPDLALWPVS